MKKIVTLMMVGAFSFGFAAMTVHAEDAMKKDEMGHMSKDGMKKEEMT